MKKILCIFGPFQTDQIAYVYEDGNKLDAVRFTIDEANKTLEHLISKYDIMNVELRGPIKYNKGIWENFTLYTQSKYGRNNFREINVKYL